MSDHAADPEPICLVTSAYVGYIRLDHSHVAVTHVLGRRRLVGSIAALKALERFGAGASTDLNAETPEVHALLRCGILSEKSSDDDAWIRAGYGASPGIEPSFPIPGLHFPLRQQVRPAAVQGELFLSASLALLPLDNAGVVATHPAGLPTRMAADLWAFAKSFRRGRRPRDDETDAAEFLTDRRILWPDPARQAAACIDAFGLDASSLPSLHTTDRLGDIFRQISPPFTIAHVNRPCVRKKIALIGPCIAQVFADSLVYHGYSLEWAIETRSMLVPDASLSDFAPDLVVLPAGQFTSGFVGLGRNREWDACEHLIARVESICSERIAAIRAHTDAPIAIGAVSPPALHALPQASLETYRFITYFARLNAKIADLAARTPDVLMVDETDARERLRISPYWDDCYNSSAHRAPLTSWGLVATIFDGHSPAGTSTRSLVDPASAMTLCVLEALLRLKGTGIEAILFEPRGLLWPEGYGWSERDRATRRSTMVDFVESWSAGIAEALAETAHRGIRLVCLSTLPETDVRMALFELTDDLIALRPQNIFEFISTNDKISVVRRLAETDAAGRNILWIDFTVTAPEAPDRVIVLGRESKWRLRELLLRSPLLSPVDRAGVPNCAPKWAHPSPPTDNDEPPTEQLAHRVRQLLIDAIGAETQSSGAELESLEHLADVGIDSLGFWRILGEVEESLGVRLDAWEREDRDAYLLSTLEQLFVMAVLRAKARTEPRI